jgi:hypothetical protein
MTNNGAFVNVRVFTIVGILCVLVVLIVAVAIGGIYDLRVGGIGIAYRFNRFTGTVWNCTGGHCVQTVEKR